MSIVVTDWVYLFGRKFDEHEFLHRDSRLMSVQTKTVIKIAQQLYAKVKGNEINSEDIGIVFSSDTGPLESILEYNSILKNKGYIGINPSKFPNIMSATALSRIAIEIGAKGPCVPLLSSKNNKHALIYGIEQISAKRCCAIMIIHINKMNDCFGLFIEDECSCHKRGIKSKLVVK
ncbi:MAG TPA: hypothetical protein DC000_01705 [Clostridiales bacterium]|nr:hypothetical protein [Clostridiales bacterium]